MGSPNIHRLCVEGESFLKSNQKQMKTLIAILSFIFIFMGLFFLLSLIGIIWTNSYRSVLAEQGWFVFYTLFIGWWSAGLCSHEIYEKL